MTQKATPIMSPTETTGPRAVQYRRWRTYSMNSMMFIVLCVAVVLGGYRLGYDHGIAEFRLLEELHIKTYFVGDLVGASREPTKYGYGGKYGLLINVIQSTVEPTHWDIVGGDGTVQFVPRVQSIVVSATQPAHDQIEELLAQLRAMAEEHHIDLSQPDPMIRPSAPPPSGTGAFFDPLP